MSRPSRRGVAACLVFSLLAAGPVNSEEEEAPAASKPAPPARLFSGHGPDPSHPFGRPHPEAPAELSQFAFMIGEFDCTDRIRQRDGSWKTTAAIWNASYFLNGMGIQDRYWNDTFATSNVRIFDPSAGRWKVTYFQMRPYNTGVWEGGQEGDTMVMKQERPDESGSMVVTSRLTFHDITVDGYRWKGESMQGGRPVTFWTSECRRRR